MKTFDSPTVHSSRRRRITKILIWVLLGAAVLYPLLGFFALPAVVRAVAVSQVEKNLHARLEIGSVSFNPFTLRLQLGDVSLQDLEGRDVVRLGGGQFAVSLSSVTRLAPVLKEVLLDEPAIFLSRNAEGEINVLQLLKETDEDPPEELPKIAIQRLRITGGAIELEDAALRRPVTFGFSPIAFDLEDFSTFQSGGNQLRFSAEDSSGGSVEGRGSFSVAPMAASAEISLRQFDLSAVASYIREFVDVDLRKGRLNLELSAAFNGDSDEEMISGNLGSLTLADFQLVAAEEESPFLALEKMEIANARFAAWDPRLDVESVRITGGNFRARRLPDGTIDLLQLLPASDSLASEKTSPEMEALAGPLAVGFSVATVGIENFAFLVEDSAAGNDARLEGRLDTAELRDISEDLGSPIPFHLDGTLLSEGRFTVTGNITPDPLAGEIELTVEAIPLSRFNPWAAPFTDLALESGAAGLSGNLTLAPASGDGTLPVVTFDGAAGIEEFEARADGEPVLAFSSFLLDGLALRSEPLSFRGELVQLTAPQAVVTLEEDGTLNLLRLLRIGSPSAGAETAETATPAKLLSSEESAKDFPLAFAIETIRVDDGAVSVSDQTVSPPFSTRLDKLAAEISGLSSDPASRASIDVTGSFPQGARLAVSGTVGTDPAQLFADTRVELAGFGLPPTSPYSGKFIGRTVADGRLDFAVDARIEEENLSAQNSIRLKNFRLGERVESGSSIHLPLDLALALLRDRNGEIAIDVPLSGRLDDPRFNIVTVATDALLGVIRNVASSPFAALGKLVGSSGDKLSEIAFAPGEFALSDEGLETIRALAAALHQRPGLRIEIAAAADPGVDRPAMVEHRFREELAAHRSTSETEQIHLASEADLIRSLYEARFGLLEAPVADEVEPLEEPERTADVPELPDEPAEDETVVESAKESRPFIVVHIPQWMRRLFSRSEAEPVTEAAEAPKAVAEPEPVGEPVESEEVVAAVAPVEIPTVEEMKERLLAQIEITDADLQKLAAARIETVTNALLETGQLDSDQVSGGGATLESEPKARFKLY